MFKQSDQGLFVRWFLSVDNFDWFDLILYIPSTIFQLYRDGSYFLVYQPKDVVGTQKNHLNQMVLFEHQK